MVAFGSPAFGVEKQQEKSEWNKDGSVERKRKARKAQEKTISRKVLSDENKSKR